MCRSSRIFRGLPVCGFDYNWLFRRLRLILLSAFPVVIPMNLASADQGAVFGQSTQSEAALIGVLYDLKQTPDHKPTTIDPADGYSHIVDEFLINDWDETILNRFYRVTRPLYATQIFIPNMNADNAPKAFGAEKLIKPSCWIIHYKGQVSPPSAGVYRFWGCADDVLAVAVDGKTVLVGCRFDTHLPLNKWKSSEPDGAQAADDPLRAGDWINLKTDEIVDLDVIVGERPGGFFNAFLLVEKKGESYEKDGQGHPILPIFQVASFDTPSLLDLNMEPVFAKDFPIWKSYQ
jgi:hypothetical protein